MDFKKKRDHWQNTQDNIFCIKGLIDYSKNFESVKPQFEVKALLDGKKIGGGFFNQLKDPTQIYDYSFKVEDIGKKKKLRIQKLGLGRFYYSTKLSYSPKLTSSVAHNAGMDIKKEYFVERKGRWIKINSPLKVKRGEIVKVDIFLSLPAARHFVVISDPIPGGFEPVNRELSTASIVDSEKVELDDSSNSLFFQRDDWISFNRGILFTIKSCIMKLFFTVNI